MNGFTKTDIFLSVCIQNRSCVNGASDSYDAFPISPVFITYMKVLYLRYISDDPLRYILLVKEI